MSFTSCNRPIKMTLSRSLAAIAVKVLIGPMSLSLWSVIQIIKCFYQNNCIDVQEISNSKDKL